MCFFSVSGCPWWLCCCVFCVFVVSVLFVVWCGGVMWGCLPRALVCVVPCAWCVVGLWLLVPASLSWGLRLVFVWVSLVCALNAPPLLAEGLRCSAPSLLARVCRFVMVVGPSPLLAQVFGCGAPPLLTGIRRSVLWVVPRHSWPRAMGVVPRHSSLGSARCGGGGSFATHGCGPRGPLLFGPRVCLCVLCGASCWCGWHAGVVCGVVAVCVCACACGVWFVGCVMLGSVRDVGRPGQRRKAEKEVL